MLFTWSHLFLFPDFNIGAFEPSKCQEVPQTFENMEGWKKMFITLVG